MYRALPADARGAPTHTLLRGASWFVDDRLLPSGWSPDHPEAARTAPVGVKGGLDGDADFGAGGDRVRFELDVASARPVTIEASLRYQTLGARWAAELLRWKTPEVEAFRALYERADRSPVVLATDRTEVTP